MTENVAIAVYLVPIILVLVLVVVGIVSTMRDKKITVNNALIVANTIINNDHIKNIVSTAIDIIGDTTHIDETAEKYLGEDAFKFTNKVKDIMITELAKIIEDAGCLSEEDDEITKLFEKYHITIEALDELCDAILNMLGYDEGKIVDLIKERITGSQKNP